VSEEVFSEFENELAIFIVKIDFLLLGKIAVQGGLTTV